MKFLNKSLDDKNKPRSDNRTFFASDAEQILNLFVFEVYEGSRYFKESSFKF